VSEQSAVAAADDAVTDANAGLISRCMPPLPLSDLVFLLDDTVTDSF